MATPPTIVLLITDRDETAERLTGLLRGVEGKRYRTERIESPEEGREGLRAGDAAACFLVCGPGAEWGMDLLREAKTAGYRTPVIAIGQTTDDTCRDDALREGAVDYLSVDEMTPALLDRVIRYCLERERLLAALQTSEAEARQLALVAKRTDNAVIITDAEGLITWVNEGFTRITEYTFDEAVGKKPGHLLQGPDTDPRTVDFMRGRLQKGKGFKAEIINYTKSGREYWLAIEVQPIRDEDGRIVNFMAIESDITERKRTEEALREREERLRAVVDNLVDGIITIGERGAIESFSPAAERIFGYPAGEVVGQNVKVLMPEPYRSEHEGYVDRYLRTGEARIIGIGREVTGRRKDGTEFPMDLAVSEMTVNDHQVFVGIVRDITQRKQMEELKDGFLRVASHDLKNPLGSILGYAELVREFTPPGQEMSERSYDFMERILKNVRVMQKIIVDFLDFHALEDGKLKLETEPCDLNGIARELIESIGETARAKEIEITADLEEGLPVVEADTARIRQVAQNLVDNAVKFSPPESHVTVLTRREDGMIRFEVRDSGPGLTDEDFQKVFQKYARLSSKPTGGEKSSGLGLAISKQLVEVHGGEIGVYNRDEGGAAFWFRLPLTPRRNEA